MPTTNHVVMFQAMMVNVTRNPMRKSRFWMSAAIFPRLSRCARQFQDGGGDRECEFLVLHPLFPE